MASDEMRERARKQVVEIVENYGHCCKEGGSNLAIGPETLEEVLAEFAREELLSAAREIRPSSDKCHCSDCRDRRRWADWLERRAEEREK